VPTASYGAHVSPNNFRLGLFGRMIGQYAADVLYYLYLPFVSAVLLRKPYGSGCTRSMPPTTTLRSRGKLVRARPAVAALLALRSPPEYRS